MLQGVQTLVPKEGVAYIECARTPAIPCYRVQCTLRQGVTGNASYKVLLMIFKIWSERLTVAILSDSRSSVLRVVSCMVEWLHLGRVKLGVSE